MNSVFRGLLESFNIIAWSLFDRAILYGPSKEVYWIPDDDQKPDIDIFIDGPERIHLIYYKQKDDDGPVILFCHGSTGNNSMRRYAYDASRLLGLNIVLWDYPGFGHSNTKGFPNHDKNYLSSIRVIEYLLNELRIDESRICVWGESVGGTFAAYLAKEFPNVRCLILWSAFSSLSDMLKDHGARFMWGLRKRTGIEDLKTKEYLEDVVCPILFVHSKTDNIVPFGNCLRNMKYAERGPAKNRIQYYEISGGHAQPLLCFDDLLYIRNFIFSSSTNKN